MQTPRTPSLSGANGFLTPPARRAHGSRQRLAVARQDSVRSPIGSPKTRFAGDMTTSVGVVTRTSDAALSVGRLRDDPGVRFGTVQAFFVLALVGGHLTGAGPIPVMLPSWSLPVPRVAACGGSSRRSPAWWRGPGSLDSSRTGTAY